MILQSFNFLFLIQKKYLCRKGSRFGHDSLVDGMLKDGLWDVYNDCGMGSCAELCAEKFQITREQQVCCSFIFLELTIVMVFNICLR